MGPAARRCPCGLEGAVSAAPPPAPGTYRVAALCQLLSQAIHGWFLAFLEKASLFLCVSLDMS